MVKPKRAKITLFDQEDKAIIHINLMMVEENKIEWVLENMSLEPFSKGWFSLFKQQLEDKFKKIGAIGIEIERLDMGEMHQNNVLIKNWKIEIFEPSKLSKYESYKPTEIKREELSDLNSTRAYIKQMEEVIKNATEGKSKSIKTSTA